MFLSRRRPIAFPQSEHARLAGHLACVWGNEAFRAPGTPPGMDVPFGSFCAGVALHDAGYGPIDRDVIGEMSEAASRERFRHLMNVKLDDRIAETIVKHHVLRLIGYTGYSDLESTCLEQIAPLIKETGVSSDVFHRLDTITDLCDSIAFHFCFEHRAEGHVDVTTCIALSDKASIHYCCSGDVDITVTPWPFSITQVCGYMLAYRTPGYPTVMQPVMVPYRILPG